MPPPTIGQLDRGVISQLVIAWYGRWGDLTGFKLFLNGSHMGSIERDSQGPAQVYDIADNLFRQCGARLEFQVSAFRGNPFSPAAESERSNTVVVETPACPRRVRVILARIETIDATVDDPPGMRRDSCWENDVGPIGLVFHVWGGSEDQVVHLSTMFGQGICNRGNGCNYIQGFCLHPNARVDFQDIVDYCRQAKAEHENDDGLACTSAYADVTVGPGQALWIAGNIGDADTDGNWNLVWEEKTSCSMRKLVPNTVFERTMRETIPIGFANVIVQIGVSPEP